MIPRQTEGITELIQGRRVAAGLRGGAQVRDYEAVLTCAGCEVLVTGAVGAGAYSTHPCCCRR